MAVAELEERLRAALGLGRLVAAWEQAVLGIVTPTWHLLVRCGEAEWFDLASLTKPLVTAWAVGHLWAQGRLSPATPVRQLLPVDPEPPTTVGHLLTHTAGLVPYRRWAEHHPPSRAYRRAVLEAVLAERPVAPLGTERYSDTGYVWLAAIVERLAGVSPWRRFREHWPDLAVAWHTLPPAARVRAVRAGTCPWRGRPLRGEVHDPNAWMLGERAGHAGLFATPAAMVELARTWLAAAAGRDLPGLPGPLARRLVTPDPRWHPARPLGWDRIGPGPSQAGRLASPGTFGHLGFTGTSLWLDPVRHAAVFLLTDRLAVDPEGTRFRRLRPELYDLAWRYVDARGSAAPGRSLRLEVDCFV